MPNQKPLPRHRPKPSINANHNPKHLSDKQNPTPTTCQRSSTNLPRYNYQPTLPQIIKLTQKSTITTHLLQIQPRITAISNVRTMPSKSASPTQQTHNAEALFAKPTHVNGFPFQTEECVPCNSNGVSTGEGRAQMVNKWTNSGI